MELNILAIAIATIAQFAFGAIWYGPIFGKLWGKIHGFEDMSKEKREEAMKGMGTLMATQFAVTVLTSSVLYMVIKGLPAMWNIYGTAMFVWIGFVVPTQISAVIFGSTKPRWRSTQIVVMAGAALCCLMIAATVFKYMM